MDIIESIKKDKAYVKCKLIVKTWEKDFKVKYSRTPSKFDIKEAPSNIKYAYKKYFQLKSTALENSLSICDIDGEILPSPEIVQSNEDITFKTLSPQTEPLLPALPSGQELEKMLSASKSQCSSDKVEAFTENLSKKLFQNRKFSLRNPRKLSIPKSQASIEDKLTPDKENNESNFVLTKELSNYESPFNVKASTSSKPVMFSSTNLTHSTETMKSPSVRNLDKAWLERSTGIKTDELPLNSSLDVPIKFGLRNIVIPNKQEQICDYVENSESEDDIAISKLKPALKKLKTSFNREEISQRHNEESVELKDQINLRKPKAPRKSKAKVILKDDDISEYKPPDIAEYLPFGLDKDIIPRHVDYSNAIKYNNSQCATDLSGKSFDNDEFDKLENKIKSGTVNENFVKINIEKKVFVRGKKNINFSKYKKQQWKNKKALHASMEFPEARKISCFKCAGFGHMARYCTAHKGQSLLPLENYDDNDIPSLEDMKKVALEAPNNNTSICDQLSKSIYEPSPIPESFMQMLGTSSDEDLSGRIKPIYTNCDEVKMKDLHEVLNMFGHQTFRPGQEHAIKRILCGMSTLLILSTGGGKSLCYQLPAYIYSKNYNCITLVISPLVSLMEDQVINMPEFLKAGCLHTNQPPTMRRKIIQCLKDGEINILLISPEALISGDTSNGFAGLFKSLPQIAFACIDEAHCVSHWSHNFRPSYLMICRVLREKLNVKCILGLTATASQTTIKSIIDHVNIPDGISGVITNPALPDNLCLSVSFEKDKDRALVAFLSSERISSFNSIIVYCIRRDECERIAAILRSCLQETGKINMEKQNKKRKRMSYIAEAYHAGMSAAQRKKIQKHFMDGTLRIIVATIAFGMGIDKSDIRCIIHYNVPSSFESYVQEVGRAGRDGKPAVCHVLMDNSNNDINELLKHIHSNSIDRPTIRKLLQKVLIPCECSKSQEMSSSNIVCKGHEVGIPIDATVEELDLPSENISTLLCYVELHPTKYIKVLNNAYIMCKISSYGSANKILEAAKSCRPLAMAYLMEQKNDPEIMNKSILEFNVIEVAAAIGWESGMTKYQLKNLEWITVSGATRRSNLKVEFNTLGFRIKARGDLTPTQLDNILNDLHGTVLFQEKSRLYQLEESNKAFKNLVSSTLENKNVPEDTLTKKSNELKSTIRSYFQRENSLPDHIKLEERPLDTERVISDVRALISSYKDCTFTGRSIARIFQGISSPNFPALVWGKCRFWRSHMHEDFGGLIKLATQQIIQMKM